MDLTSSSLKEIHEWEKCVRYKKLEIFPSHFFQLPHARTKSISASGKEVATAQSRRPREREKQSRDLNERWANEKKSGLITELNIFFLRYTRLVAVWLKRRRSNRSRRSRWKFFRVRAAKLVWDWLERFQGYFRMFSGDRCPLRVSCHCSVKNKASSAIALTLNRMDWTETTF